MEIPQHLGPDISTTLPHLLRAVRLRRLLGRLFGWLAGRLAAERAGELASVTRSAAGDRRAGRGLAALSHGVEQIMPPAPGSIAPGSFEATFARLHQERSYEDMWDLLADDAQRSWGSRQHFVERMRRQAAEYELLEANVGEVDIMPVWTDRRRNRTYRNVARVAVRYRIRHGWREVAMNRHVHLVPAAGGWRTLYYPQEN